IYHFDAQVGEVLDVSRSKFGSARDNNSRDLRVSHIDRLTYSLPSCREFGGRLSCELVEVEHAPLEIFDQQHLEGGFERVSALTFRQQREAQSCLEQRNACNPDRLRRLAI